MCYNQPDPIKDELKSSQSFSIPNKTKEDIYRGQIYLLSHEFAGRLLFRPFPTPRVDKF